MNNTIRELMERKSVRAFTGQDITEEQREQIPLAAMAAPTAGNQQMYTIIDVQHPEIKEQLAELCDHQSFISIRSRLQCSCSVIRRSSSPSGRNLTDVL